MTLAELQRLKFAISDVEGYLTDNSCSDPDCCGGPFYERDEYDRGAAVMREFGLEAPLP